MKVVILILTISMVLITGSLLSSTDLVRKKFDAYADIPINDGVHTWLPNFFPSQAKKIDFTSNLDTNIFYVTFYLDKGDAIIFERDLHLTSSEKAKDSIAQYNVKVDRAWCKLGFVLGQGEQEDIYLIGRIDNEENKYLLENIYYNREEGREEQIQKAVVEYCSK